MADPTPPKPTPPSTEPAPPPPQRDAPPPGRKAACPPGRPYRLPEPIPPKPPRPRPKRKVVADPLATPNRCPGGPARGASPVGSGRQASPAAYRRSHRYPLRLRPVPLAGQVREVQHDGLRQRGRRIAGGGWGCHAVPPRKGKAGAPGRGAGPVRSADDDLDNVLRPAGRQREQLQAARAGDRLGPDALARCAVDRQVDVAPARGQLAAGGDPFLDQPVADVAALLDHDARLAAFLEQVRPFKAGAAAGEGAVQGRCAPLQG